VTVGIVAAPPVTKRLSVKPPRLLAKEYFNPPGMAANAAWSRRFLRGPTIKPVALSGLGAGRCNALAPDQWEVRGHANDDSMLHVAAKDGFMHAIFQSTPLGAGEPRRVLLAALKDNFGTLAAIAAPEQKPFGFTLFHYGLVRGAGGFVLYRVTNARLFAWIVAVPAADAAWAEPLAGAVALSMHCPGPVLPRVKGLTATAVSDRCLEGSCEESDYAGAAMGLRLGYVHDSDGGTYLVDPRHDFWQDGAEGPGFYRQIGGANEKLEPGRTN